MNDNHGNPARLKDRHDQPDLVERIAGQAARDMPEPPQISANTLARIAMRIEERTSKPRMLRLGPVLVAASVLLGVVTVASAARMDLLPRWIAKLVGIERRSVSTETTSRVGKAPPAKKGSGHPVVPRAVEPTLQQPEAQPSIAPAPAPQGPVTGTTLDPAQAARVTESANRHNAVDGAASPRRLAMVEAKAPQRLAERPAKPGPKQDSASAEVGLGRRIDAPAPLATKSSSFDRGLAPVTPVPVAPALPSMQPLPAVAEPRAATAAAPPERPTPPSQPDPAPVQPSPTPASNPPAPGHSPAARHLKDVVHALRVEHAPQTALDLLDRHARELAGNAFAEEALLLRVEAMLALKQQPEALRLLDGMSLANAASSSVLLVTRGQLRANANRCAEAIADFDLALARALRPSKQALLGRAQCKQKLGDPQSAEADLERLHREFP